MNTNIIFYKVLIYIEFREFILSNDSNDKDNIYFIYFIKIKGIYYTTMIC